jgi:hypothetical protein
LKKAKDESDSSNKHDIIKEENNPVIPTKSIDEVKHSEELETSPQQQVRFLV